MPNSKINNASNLEQALPKRRAWISLIKEPEQLPYTLKIHDKFTVEHLIKVLRLAVGEKIIVISETLGIGYIAEIKEVENKSIISLTLQQALPQEKVLAPKLVLVSGLIKESHWEWLLQKATELGVSEIIPLRTKFSDIQPRMIKPERWQHIVKAAALQCERLSIPKLHPLIEIDEFLKRTNNASQDSKKLLLQERAKHIPNLLSLLLDKNTNFCRMSEVIFAIGPEGGWHEGEIKQFKESQFQPTSLGKSILRADTASLIALSTIQQAIAYQLEVTES